MLISWGFLLPLGVSIAKFMRHRDPLWFRLHRGIQITGTALAIAGFLIAITQFSVFEPGYFARAKIHGFMGLFVMTLGIWQPINAYFRPHKDKTGVVSRERQRWEMLHKGSGYAAIFVALPTIVLGTTLVGGSSGTIFQVMFGILLTALCVAAAYARVSSDDTTPKGTDVEMK